MAVRNRQSGFTLIEVMISAVLLSILLSAIGLATHASLMAQKENTDMAGVNQTARVLLMRMRRDIRTASAVDHTAPANKLVIFPPDNGSNPDEVTYEYNSVTRTLYHRQTTGVVTTTEVVMDGSSPVQMTAFSALYDVGVTQDAEGNPCSYTRRATVTLEFTAGRCVSAITCSASPRRNQAY